MCGFFGLVALVGLSELLLFGGWIRRQAGLFNGLAISFWRLNIQFLYLFSLLVVFAELGVHDAGTEAHFLQAVVWLYVERVGRDLWLFYGVLLCPWGDCLDLGLKSVGRDLS